MVRAVAVRVVNSLAVCALIFTRSVALLLNALYVVFQTELEQIEGVAFFPPATRSVRVRRSDLNFFDVASYVPEGVVKPVWTWLLQVDTETLKVFAVEPAVEEFSTHYVPVLGVVFELGIFHELVVLEHRYPVAVMAHFLARALRAFLGKLKLADCNGVRVEVLEHHVREQRRLRFFVERYFHVLRTGLLRFDRDFV